MDIRLRDVIPEEELKDRFDAILNEFLDRVVTVQVYQGKPKPTKAPMPDVPIVCPECGQDNFRTRAALGGHR